MGLELDGVFFVGVVCGFFVWFDWLCDVSLCFCGGLVVFGGLGFRFSLFVGLRCLLVGVLIVTGLDFRSC